MRDVIAQTIAIAHVQQPALRRRILQRHGRFVDLAEAGVPDYRAVHPPFFGNAARQLAGQRRTSLFVRLVALAGQRHPSIFEVQDLPDTGAQVLASVARTDQAAGQTDRQLVGVADTVESGEAVVSKQLVVSERQLRGIELRQAILVLVALVQVEHLRFQRMAQRLPERLHRAIEIQPALDAG